jgi:2-methylcitrate dehydratase PrpD
VDVTRRLAEFAVETRYRDFPAEVVEKGKERILDTLGCMIGGCREALAPLMVKYAEEAGGRSEATIVGFGHKTGVANAALVNGTLGHALDFDDTQISFSGHPSTVILPAALSLGEKLNLSGKVVLEAFMVGFEVACKIGRGVNPRLYRNGWHATSVIGTLGAAIAGGKVLGLDADKMASALGLAASQSCGLKENFGTMTKPFHAGRAAQSGVISALLARHGFTASQQILGAKRGFCAMFAGEYDLDGMVENLGNPYDIISPGVHTKPYPSCLMTHPIIDATLSLAESHNIQPEDVDWVVCEIAPLASEALIHPNPQTGLQAKFSAQYVVTAALFNRKVSLEHFMDEKLQDLKTQALIKRVKISVHPELESPLTPAKVRMKLKNGLEVAQRVDIATGNPEKPMSLDQMIAKYKNCVESMMSVRKADETIDRILHFEEVRDVSKLIALTAKEQK